MPPPIRNDMIGQTHHAQETARPTSMKTSRIANAIATSRRITIGRRFGATRARQLMKIGMLPSGSVIRISRMVADRKLYSTVRSA